MHGLYARHSSTLFSRLYAVEKVCIARPKMTALTVMTASFPVWLSTERYRTPAPTERYRHQSTTSVQLVTTVFTSLILTLGFLCCHSLFNCYELLFYSFGTRLNKNVVNDLYLKCQLCIEFESKFVFAFRLKFFQH